MLSHILQFKKWRVFLTQFAFSRHMLVTAYAFSPHSVITISDLAARKRTTPRLKFQPRELAHREYEQRPEPQQLFFYEDKKTQMSTMCNLPKVL